MNLIDSGSSWVQVQGLVERLVVFDEHGLTSIQDAEDCPNSCHRFLKWPLLGFRGERLILDYC